MLENSGLIPLIYTILYIVPEQLFKHSNNPSQTPTSSIKFNKNLETVPTKIRLTQPNFLQIFNCVGRLSILPKQIKVSRIIS